MGLGVSIASCSKGATEKTLMATLEHIQSLHAECDWLLQYYEVIVSAFWTVIGDIWIRTFVKFVFRDPTFSSLQDDD